MAAFGKAGATGRRVSRTNLARVAGLFAALVEWQRDTKPLRISTSLRLPGEWSRRKRLSLFARTCFPHGSRGSLLSHGHGRQLASNRHHFPVLRANWSGDAETLSAVGIRTLGNRLRTVAQFAGIKRNSKSRGLYAWISECARMAVLS